MIAVVHLVWAPLGVAPLREFIRTYRAHPAGAEHELTIVLNGAGAGGPASAAERRLLLAEMGDIEHRLITLERPMLDLPAYGEAARILGNEHVCLLNSYATILTDGWLAAFAVAAQQPGVGLVGATGSWESQAELGRGSARYWPLQLAGLPRARRDYPRFPNPHVRTSTFMIDRLRLVAMGLESARDKRATYLFESGRRSITRIIGEEGLRGVVVGRDGRAYDVDEWPASHTFRSGEQQNLLVADNQTRDYQAASPARRRRLTRDSWGPGYHS